MPGNSKKTGLVGAIAIGVGGMVGGGTFAVLGEAVATSDGATPVAFLIAGCVALLTSISYALAVAAEPALGTAGFVVVAVAALLATLSAINATIYGNARLGYVLAKDG